MEMLIRRLWGLHEAVPILSLKMSGAQPKALGKGRQTPQVHEAPRSSRSWTLVSTETVIKGDDMSVRNSDVL